MIYFGFCALVTSLIPEDESIYYSRRGKIRCFSAIDVFAEIFSRCLGHKQCISTHYFSIIKDRYLYSRTNFRGTENHEKRKNLTQRIFPRLRYIKLKSCLSDCHASILAVSASIETGLVWNESWVFWHPRVYFYKSKRGSIHPHECAKRSDVTQNSL